MVKKNDGLRFRRPGGGRKGNCPLWISIFAILFRVLAFGSPLLCILASFKVHVFGLGIFSLLENEIL